MLISSRIFPPRAAAFEVPSVPQALELLGELRTDWVGWVENGLDGTFVVVLAPEAVGDLDQLLSRVDGWITGQRFLALRFHLDGCAYIMQRGGVVRPVDGDGLSN